MKTRVVILNYICTLPRHVFEVYVLYEIVKNKAIALEAAAWNPDPSVPLITKFR